MRVDGNNGRSMGIGKGRIRKLWWFSSNEYWNNVGYLILARTFGLGGSRLREKEEQQNISENKSKSRSIWLKVYLYGFCVYSILCMLFYIIL